VALWRIFLIILISKTQPELPMKYFFLALALTLFAGSHLQAEDAVQPDDIFKKLLAAQVAKDYEAFVADGTTNLKAALTKTQFMAASDLMVPRLAAGYDVVPLGNLHQRGYDVYLYRLRCKDGSDDILGTLSLQDGKVAGIYFK